MSRFGRIALAGRPNAGKSSLLNAILGTHLSLVSSKAQATRLPVQGIVTRDDTQMLFVDLPGLLDPAYLLQRSMRGLALDALPTVDLILHLHPAGDAPAPAFSDLVADAPPYRAPVLVVYTKGDTIAPDQRRELAREAVVTSAQDPASVERLLLHVAGRLPHGDFQFAADDIATQPTRFFVTEYLREAAFEALEDEVPYAFAAEVEEYREDPKPIYIRTTLYVERESQKGIVIGKGGATLKRIGAHARARLEALLGEKVYIETWVKVLPHWRRNASALVRFGFPIPDHEVA